MINEERVIIERERRKKEYPQGHVSIDDKQGFFFY
jgi:hypothetical protein